MIERSISRCLNEAMADTPVVLVHGARQTGKSTLVKAYADSVKNRQYLTLDDATMLGAATEDPEGFLSRYEGPEIGRAHV